MEIGLSTIASRMNEKHLYPYYGLIHRSQGIQLYAFLSCTGWILLVGLEYGAFDADEVRVSVRMCFVNYIDCAIFF